MARLHVMAMTAVAFFAAPVCAADYPAPRQDDWIARDFRFHTGDAVGIFLPI
jgi:homoserine O-acetyltransferase/O-succinyltransferase